MLLTDAKDIKVGTTTAKAVYVGATKVWPSATFKPSDVSELKVWLDAADFAAGAWANKAAGGTATTIQGAPAPTRSANTLNSLPLVRFKANEGRLRILASSGVDREWTLVYIARNVGPLHGRIVDAVYPPNNLLVGFWTDFKDVLYDSGFGSNGQGVPVVEGEWKMYSGDGTATGTLSRLFSNGVLLGSTSTGAGWGGTFSVNGYGSTTPEESNDCEIAEVCQYSRKLSDAERQQVEGYLRTKWGLA